MRSHLLIFVVTSLASAITGCSNKQQASTQPAAPVTAVRQPAGENGGPGVILALKEPTAEERYDASLLEALRQLAERRYPEALAALKAAQAAQDSEQVREQIARVQGLQLRQQSLDQTAADIQAVLDQGQGALAAQLAVQALAQYGDGDETTRLSALKRQADALLAAKEADLDLQITRFRGEAETALKDNNLRAALLASEQLQSVHPDAAARQRTDELEKRLTRYDAARERARRLRQDNESLEEAVAACQEAIEAWDTLQARQELADTQLALEKRRERLAIATFELQGDASLAALGATLADELLPHLRRRYDIVERGHLEKVLSELKLSNDDLLVGKQGRTDLGRLVKARYLVVGSVSSLSGVTVHARLVDLRSGLVVQTARIVAPSAAEVARNVPQLAAMLLMSDEEKLAYEQQLARESAPAVVSTSANLPPVPVGDGSAMPPPLATTSNRPPNFGGIQADDFDRLPPMPAFAGNAAAPSMAPAVLPEQERPLRSRLLTLNLELGDNLLRRGRHAEAFVRFQLARELDPANLDILTRINLCQPYLPPGPIRPIPRVRERVAFLNFFVIGDARVVPPALSTWTPEHLALYFAGTYELIDPAEVYWMMGRLGLTVGDVVREASARRWLGRSLGVRHLVMGRIQQTGSFTVTTSLVDTEQGWEIGRGQVFAHDPLELKLRLPELACLTLAGPVERARLEQLAAEQETVFLRAQEAYQRGQFSVAMNLALGLKQKNPFSVRVEFLIGESDRRARLAALDEARRFTLDRERHLAELAARRQAELALAAESARHEALHQAARLAEAERRRLRETACDQLVAQARVAFRGNQFTLAVQFFDGAIAFRPFDAALLQETAVARMRVEHERLRMLAEQQARRSETARRQADLDIAVARQAWQAERQQFAAGLTAFVDAQHQKDEAEYIRLLDQAQRLKTQGRFDQAAAALQTARRIRASDEVERLLADALMDQARAQIRIQDASRVRELEAKLAQEQKHREQAEKEAQRNWQLYQATLQAAQVARQQRNFIVAVAKYQEAGKIFQTGDVVTGLREAQAAVEQQARLAADQKREAEDTARRSAALARLVTAGRAAEQARKYEEALTVLRQAKDLDPGSVEVLAALTRVEQAKTRSLQERQAVDQALRVKDVLAQAQARVQAHQFDAALALLEGAQKLAPNDAQILPQIVAVKKAQADAQAAVLAAKSKEEEARHHAALRIQQEEQARQQAAQARLNAENALRTGDLKVAETAVAAAAKLTPNDPAVRKLQQDLTRAQGVAARDRAQADARSRLEEEANRRMTAAQQAKVNDLVRQAQQAAARKDFATAENLLNSAASLDPTNLAIGKAQREVQNGRKADADARTVITAERKKKEEDELARKKSEFTKLMKDGKEALAAEEFDKAAKLFDAAAKVKPEDADAPLLLGMARRDVERAKAETAAARKAAIEEETRKKQEDADSRKRAMAEADAKKKSDDDLRKRLAMDAEAKKRAEALKALARQQFDNAMTTGKDALAAKRYDDAIKSFERAAQLLPQDKEAAAQLATARRFKEATVKPTPDKPPLPKPTAPEKMPAQLLAEATRLQQQRKWAEALVLYRQVLKSNANDKAAKAGAIQCEFQVELQAGKTALTKKDKEAAVKAFESALKLSPKHAETQRLLQQAKGLK